METKSPAGRYREDAAAGDFLWNGNSSIDNPLFVCYTMGRPMPVGEWREDKKYG